MTPLGVALEFQRGLLETGQRTVETSIDVQGVFSRSLVEGIERQREFQQRLLGRQYLTLRQTLHRTDEETPGPAVAENLLGELDGQLADLQADREAATDTLVATVEATDDTVETLALDSLDAAEEQLTAVESLLAELGALKDDTDRRLSSGTHRA